MTPLEMAIQNMMRRQGPDPVLVEKAYALQSVSYWKNSIVSVVFSLITDMDYSKDEAVAELMGLIESMNEDERMYITGMKKAPTA